MKVALVFKFKPLGSPEAQSRQADPDNRGFASARPGDRGAQG